MKWFWEHPQKSLADCDKLVHDVLLDKQFRLDELHGFSARQETALMDKALAKDSDRWHESTVSFEVPDGRPHHQRDDSPVPTFRVDGLMHRSVVEVIRTVWSSPDSQGFQYVPFRRFCRRPDSRFTKRPTMVGKPFCKTAYVS